MSRLGDWARRVGIVPTPAPVEEAARKAQAGPATVTRQGFEYGIPVQGLTEANAGYGSSTAADRATLMTDLYDAHLACPWSWAGVNAIARTVTGGGLAFEWDQDDGEGDQEQPDKPLEVLQCERLLKFVNPREDIIQLLRAVISDLLVFGDAFIEVVWAAGIPVALYSLDCPSTTPIADSHGNVTKYVQVTDQNQRAEFDVHEVIHISLDAPRSGIFGVSPTYAALLPIKIWLFASATLQELYRKGLPPTLHVDHPQSMQDADQRKWVDQYMTRNIGPRNIGRPITTRNGGVVSELQPHRIEEILHTLDQRRDEILATYGVPPAEAGVIESGNLGGGTGEAQRKQFLTNTCHPIAALVLEKLNFVLLNAFGVDGWRLKFNEVDMRDSQIVETIRDMRLRNGSWTLDRYRTEIGEPPTDGGDVPVLVDRQNIVLWRDMAALSTAMIAKNAGAGGLEIEKPENSDEPTRLIKPEPKPVPVALASAGGLPGAGGGEHPGAAGGVPAAAPQGHAPAEVWHRGRPLRESWSQYATRKRRAQAELPLRRAA